MIRLPEVTLSPSARAGLLELQHRVDTNVTYERRVQSAKILFSQKNRPRNATFRQVRNSLSTMCSGPRRCMYCEDSAADEVEHIRPKDLYPEVAFEWDNYLYACGGCNGRKNNHFSVFSANRLIDVSRPHGAPIEPPTLGDPALINPRIEDPLEFMRLDIIDTFHFIPIGGSRSRKWRRARYTIDSLGLNDRDFLPVARRDAYSSYRAQLREYSLAREHGAGRPELEAMVTAVKRKGQPAVWREMKLQHKSIPELQQLFKAVPEALEW